MTANDIAEIKGDTLQLNFHAGQLQAWDSICRIVAIIAGTQGGKTSFTPYWLLREMQMCGPGDYIYVTPTFQLLAKKALPEFQRVFESWFNFGKYKGSPSRQFIVSDDGFRRLFKREKTTSDPETRVLFGYATDPESLESATGKAAVLDEAGQGKFKLGSWEAVLRRLSIHQGRALITTTIYNLGWLKTQIYDRWVAGDKEIDIIRFASNMNPMFPQEEFEKARERLQAWKFNMQYMAQFERPAGMIFDCFNDDINKCPRFDIPAGWKRIWGMDFGGVNTAVVFFAVEPSTNRKFLYREYKAGGRTAKQHAEAMLKGEPFPSLVVGGSPSEQQWRDEFKAAGIPVKAPDQPSVEIGIDRVYGAIQSGEIVIFDDCDNSITDIGTYSRKLDENGEPTEDIEDKNQFHFCDAIRYPIGYLKRPSRYAKAAGRKKNPGRGR